MAGFGRAIPAGWGAVGIADVLVVVLMGATAGYARVSTRDQMESLDAQKTALLGAGADRVFCDVISGAKSARPGLCAALDWLREGDTLLVTRLDRLGRSTVDTLRTVAERDCCTDR